VPGMKVRIYVFISPSESDEGNFVASDEAGVHISLSVRSQKNRCILQDWNEGMPISIIGHKRKARWYDDFIVEEIEGHDDKSVVKQPKDEEEADNYRRRYWGMGRGISPEYL